MIAALSPILPNGAAFWQRLCLIMDIVLHLGAHRTGTTTFQAYLKDKTDILDQAGIAVWRPAHTRKGLFDGLIPNAMNKAWRKDMQRRAEGRVKMRLSDQESDGYHTTLISDENMLGSIQGNIREFRAVSSSRRAHVAVFACIWRARGARCFKRAVVGHLLGILAVT